ncbi:MULTISPECIES: chemotaxis protein CheD [unclassified Rhodosalinus]|uniref:chemotaxis protein CheD n=1 Tax=unclassified Rhodosalinus TaxID=2630183 RepID=UPI00352612D4
MNTQHVIQGEFRVADGPDDVFVTVLGSCIATCLTDRVAGVGGMNHFLLPHDTVPGGKETRYGINAMELLINAILKSGGALHRLEAKVFGGANTTGSRLGIGDANAEFAFWFLRNEGIRCVGYDVGGTRARKLRYWPRSGIAQQMVLPAAFAPDPEPRPACRAPLAGPGPGDLDLL